jgi:hypothetical protein
VGKSGARKCGFPRSGACVLPRDPRRRGPRLDELLAFYDYPAEHWIHLRTTNPVNRVDIRHSQAADQGHQGPWVETAALAMAFKLIEAAQRRWRMLNAPHLVALVHAGAKFVNGKLVERPDD